MKHYSQERVYSVLKGLHREFPEFGEIKVIDHDRQEVTVRTGPPYTPSAKAYKFRIESSKNVAQYLVYRRQRREL